MIIIITILIHNIYKYYNDYSYYMNQEIELVKNRDRRESKGRVIALSRKIYRIINSDVFYVESESKDGMYYYIGFNPDKEIEYCSCNDFSNRGKVCKHIHGIEYAIKFNVVIDTDKLPNEAKKDNTIENKNIVKSSGMET